MPGLIFGAAFDLSIEDLVAVNKDEIPGADFRELKVLLRSSLLWPPAPKYFFIGDYECMVFEKLVFGLVPNILSYEMLPKLLLKEPLDFCGDP